MAADLVIFTKSLHPVRPSAHHLVEPSRLGNHPCRNGYQIDCYIVIVDHRRNFRYPRCLWVPVTRILLFSSLCPSTRVYCSNASRTAPNTSQKYSWLNRSKQQSQNAPTSSAARQANLLLNTWNISLHQPNKPSVMNRSI